MAVNKQSNGTSNGIQVIARAASILRALENEQQGLSLGDIAARVELPRSTVQRIVAALADEQLLIAASPRSRVKLGPALVRLANATSVEINSIVRPYLESLSGETGETIDFSIVQGRRAVFIDQVSGNHRLRAVSAIGEAFPLHATACGKALLSTFSTKQLDKFLKTPLQAYTENTITDAAALSAEMAKIRESGYSIDREEHSEGICAVGTFIEDAMGRSYSISIPTPSSRFQRNELEYTEALLDCRNAILGALH